MKEFSRKWEKRIAWTANILFIFWLIIFGYIALTSSAAELVEYGLDLGMPVEYAMVWLRATTGGAAIFFLIAIIATIFMKRRILSGILFLVTAIITFNSGYGLFLVAIPYLIVAIMLFVRKEKIKE